MDDEKPMHLVTSETAKELAALCMGVLVEEIDALDETIRYAAINVPTKQGKVRASEGDYVGENGDGTFFVLKHRQVFG